MKTPTEKDVKQSLIDNLEARGMVEAFYIDKVAEYCHLWTLLKSLKDNINQYGTHVYNEKSGVYEPNKSIALEIQVSRQMLALYTAMGFKADASKPIVNDDDAL